MNEEATKLLGVVVAVVAIVVVAAVFGGRLLGAAAGPENELITQVKQQERAPVFGSLTAKNVSYQRLSVTVSPTFDSATVSGTLDFTGTFGTTTVSSLGFERVRFVRRDDAWVAVDGFAPRLNAIVRALERRRKAIEAADIPDAAGLDVVEAAKVKAIENRRFTVDGWFIRSEKEGVEVSESFRLEGRLPDRPVDEKGSRRLSLEEDPRGEFLFPHGLL